MTAPDDAWLGPLRRRLRRDVRVAAREPLTGGYGSGGAERVDLDDGTAVVLKRTGAAEAAAMRAAAVVNGPVRLPRMLASGEGWVLLEHVPGDPLPGAAPVPDEVWRTLALVHAHWRRNRPRGVPVVDPAWWARLCGLATDALAGGHARTGAAAFAEAGDRVRAWAADTRVGTALSALPRTLCHGDAHRGNVVATPDGGGVLLDWGNARVAPGSLDAVVLTAPPAEGPADAEPDPVPPLYREALHEALGAADPPRMIAAERAWARVQAHVQYLPFAADHLGADRVASSVRVIDDALAELGGQLGG